MAHASAAAAAVGATGGLSFSQRRPYRSNLEEEPEHALWRLGRQRGRRGSDQLLNAAMSRWGTLAVRWGLPVAFFVLALCVRGLALRAASLGYVLWMYDLNGIAASAGVGDSYVQSIGLVLDDSLAALLGGRPGEAGWFEAVVLLLLPLIWAVSVLHMRDLQLWTQTLLSGAVLVSLSALLASVTVLPDAASFRDCESRLGADTLTYYLGAAQGSNFGTALVEGLWLQAQDMWSFPTGGQTSCGEAMFSYSACTAVLFARSLYDVLRGPIVMGFENSESASRLAAVIQNISACLLLASVVLATMVLSIGRQQIYTAEAFIASIATLVLYGNPAIVIVSERWAKGSPQVTASNSTWQVAVRQESLLFDEADISMAPLCWMTDLFHLRARPCPVEEPSRIMKVAEEFRQKTEAFRSGIAQLAEEEREKELAIKAKDKEQEVMTIRKRDEFAAFLSRENEKLDAEAANAIVEAEEAFASERRAAAKREAVLNEELAARRAAAAAAVAAAKLEGLDDTPSVLANDEVEITVTVAGGGPSVALSVAPETKVKELTDMALTEFGRRGVLVGTSSASGSNGGENKGLFSLTDSGKRLCPDRAAAGLPKALILLRQFAAPDVSGSWLAENEAGGFLITLKQDSESGEVTGKSHFPGQKDGVVSGKVKDGYCRLSLGGSRGPVEHGSYKVRTGKGGQLLWDIEGEWSAIRTPPLADRGNATHLAGKWFWPLTGTVFMILQDKVGGKASGSITVPVKRWGRDRLNFDGYVNGNVLVLSIEGRAADGEPSKRSSALARVSADGLTVEGDGIAIPGESKGTFTWWRATDQADLHRKPVGEDTDDDASNASDACAADVERANPPCGQRV
eukprot:TRINITY_DN15027_c0_g1_i1.p1 TRINITY_DN15027_c0_g1~~TRINITY_DN15027_c0_g1_i1.p1  ORF type:complete len:894 (+),score=170.87 TRINITY_DN15027_c0_g1_i1:116-2683(+)